MDPEKKRERERKEQQLRGMLKTVKNREFHHMVNDQMEIASEGTVKEINEQLNAANPRSPSKLSKLSMSRDNSVSTVTD